MDEQQGGHASVDQVRQPLRLVRRPVLGSWAACMATTASQRCQIALWKLLGAVTTVTQAWAHPFRLTALSGEGASSSDACMTRVYLAELCSFEGLTRAPCVAIFRSGPCRLGAPGILSGRHCNWHCSCLRLLWHLHACRTPRSVLQTLQFLAFIRMVEEGGAVAHCTEASTALQEFIDLS